ncbi:hypothetical protein [Pseudomonas sp. 14P_5.3_Bac1]|uniref:hypothetical protein n=1 Tax=Pseudomonas sp. 14P_5.3_Bac1 TaxID=2971622 RepID=UPI0021C7276A|nr:hypothetical protein [Pseudomonas sp. 14P_5.3_Bac1]MCU1778654.1 hypothetical protein [Pseudomonas sp. 14P_5.3_Bac1]
MRAGEGLKLKAVTLQVAFTGSAGGFPAAGASREAPAFQRVISPLRSCALTG